MTVIEVTHKEHKAEMDDKFGISGDRVLKVEMQRLLNEIWNEDHPDPVKELGKRMEDLNSDIIANFV